MDYSFFPSARPDEPAVMARVADVIEETLNVDIGALKNMAYVTRITREPRTSTEVMVVPLKYREYIKHLLFRRFALATILHHSPKLDIKPYKAWAVIAQNFSYVDKVWTTLQEEVRMVPLVGTTWRSAMLERYAVIEAVVKRHEPVFLSEYRRTRRSDDHHLNSTPVHAIDWDGFSQSFKKKHPLFSGGKHTLIIPLRPMKATIVPAMLIEALSWYDDKDRPLISE
ncbi:hypothetical protein PAXRUDRAFT_21303 [Paxillus rubicundulus Ve08.2h10]|uniref:Uncharacterized protein n=1 Tax=Paxillus rubicundulus Ve08.2h10 TaxID=930991 RepID=A0A0D0CZV8_9AGAM|nr:hypothetical protein PAXRUDRAFT_21303 [Paxillus rubicundulus Ve08.2h10]